MSRFGLIWRVTLATALQIAICGGIGELMSLAARYFTMSPLDMLVMCGILGGYGGYICGGFQAKQIKKWCEREIQRTSRRL